MLRLLVLVSLLVPSTAFADDREGYAGLTAFVFEVSADGGYRLPMAPYLWVRGRVATGFEPGDSSDEEWTAAFAGLEVRTRHRLVRVSAGLEAGAMRTLHKDESGPVERDWGYAWSWHAFVELGDRVMGRLGVQGMAPYGHLPAPTVGLAVRF